MSDAVMSINEELDMSDFNVLKEYYIRYLRDIRGAKESTVNHYLGALNTISKYLIEKNKILVSIYEIEELGELEIVRSYLYGQPDFVEKDERGNRMYSAGLNNYIRFAEGQEFKNVGRQVECLDIIVPVGNLGTAAVTSWKRNGIIKKQSIEMANYTCEVDSVHDTFIAESTQQRYMEGHHAIPMKNQGSFSVSLDVYANIVCLCPVCHRLLHYGLRSDKESVLNRIYAERADRLKQSGIILSKEEFLDRAI